jgi:hypothetical protein
MNEQLRAAPKVALDSAGCCWYVRRQSYLYSAKMRLSVTAVPEIIENGTPNTRLHNLILYLTKQHCSTIAITELLQKNI